MNIVSACGDGMPSKGGCRIAGLANCQWQLVLTQLDVGVGLGCHSAPPSTVRSWDRSVPLLCPVRDKHVVKKIRNIGTYRDELFDDIRNPCGELGKGNLSGWCALN